MTKNQVPATLDAVLQEAVHVGADGVVLEWVSEGLEIAFMSGHVGFGIVLTDREAASGLIDDLYKRARLAKRGRGAIDWDQQGLRYRVMVSSHDLFGETAYRLRIRKRATKKGTAAIATTLSRPIHPMPDFVVEALEQRKLWDAYRSRPPYQQNDYMGWINRAKREETKQKRLEQMLYELERGDLYMKMDYRPAST